MFFWKKLSELCLLPGPGQCVTGHCWPRAPPDSGWALPFAIFRDGLRWRCAARPGALPISSYCSLLPCQAWNEPLWFGTQLKCKQTLARLLGHDELSLTFRSHWVSFALWQPWCTRGGWDFLALMDWGANGREWGAKRSDSGTKAWDSELSWVFERCGKKLFHQGYVVGKTRWGKLGIKVWEEMGCTCLGRKHLCLLRNLVLAPTDPIPPCLPKGTWCFCHHLESLGLWGVWTSSQCGSHKRHGSACLAFGSSLSKWSLWEENGLFHAQQDLARNIGFLFSPSWTCPEEPKKGK